MAASQTEVESQAAELSKQAFDTKLRQLLKLVRESRHTSDMDEDSIYAWESIIHSTLNGKATSKEVIQEYNLLYDVLTKRKHK